MTVTAIIPTWNRADLLRSVIGNLQAQSRPPDRIHVIDNGSADGSADVARALGADVTQFPENRGFAVAVNEGITAAADAEWLFLLNNDVELSSNWLETALRAGAETSAAFVCGKLLRPANRSELDGSWDLPSRGMYAWRCGYGKRDGPVWSERKTIFWAPMTAVLYRREVFERLGLLDVRFGSYYEDVEFGLRCAIEGVAGLYEPALQALHGSKTTLGKSSRRVYFFSSRNQVYILAKHFPPATLRRFAWPLLVGQTLSLAAAAKQRNFLAGIQGKWAGWRSWRAIRGRFPEGRDRIVERRLSESEREIRDLQEKSGYDSYWRAYFRMV